MDELERRDVIPDPELWISIWSANLAGAKGTDSKRHDFTPLNPPTDCFAMVDVVQYARQCYPSGDRAFDMI